jgi:hypothetical protein
MPAKSTRGRVALVRQTCDLIQFAARFTEPVQIRQLPLTQMK